MTDTYDITDIRTGENFDGSRVAVIAAPDGAKPGSLEPLTRYFHTRGIEAQLGYAGSGHQHVLRLHGLASDTALQDLLQEYPAWEDGQNIADRAHAAHIRFPADLQFAPLENAPDKQKRSFTQAIREKSTSISASAYMAGNLGLVFSALYGNKQGEKKEVLKLGAPICYTMASAFLFFLNRKQPEPRSMEQIWDSLSPDLLRDDYTPSPDEAEQNRKAGGKAIGHVWEFMQKHPWEVNGLLNMVGAGSHMASSLLRGQRTEAMAALSTLTAMAITTFVPEKGKHADFADRAFAGVGEGITLGGAKLADDQHGIFQPFFDAGKKLTDWIQEKPLRAASFIQLAANTGYGAAALNKRDAEGNRTVDYGLLASSGTYITGNAFQAIATKTNGPSFDDIVSKAARAIAEQTDWQHQSPEELHSRLRNVAAELTKQPEIGHSQKQLAAGMMERLARERGDSGDTSRDVMDGFIPTEKAELKKSPFLSPHQVEAAINTHRHAEHAR